jgi:hypothetical protein
MVKAFDKLKQAFSFSHVPICTDLETLFIVNGNDLWRPQGNGTRHQINGANNFLSSELVQTQLFHALLAVRALNASTS